MELSGWGGSTDGVHGAGYMCLFLVLSSYTYVPWDVLWGCVQSFCHMYSSPCAALCLHLCFCVVFQLSLMYWLIT